MSVYRKAVSPYGNPVQWCVILVAVVGRVHANKICDINHRARHEHLSVVPIKLHGVSYGSPHRFFNGCASFEVLFLPCEPFRKVRRLFAAVEKVLDGLLAVIVDRGVYLCILFISKATIVKVVESFLLNSNFAHRCPTSIQEFLPDSFVVVRDVPMMYLQVV